MSLQSSSLAPPENPLVPAAAGFPLGRRFNARPELVEPWDAVTTQSYGLRHLRPVADRNTVPVPQASYCPRRQLAVIGDLPVVNSPMLASQVMCTLTTREDTQSWPDNVPDATD